MKRYLSRIKQYSWVLLVCTVLATISGILLVRFQPPTYQVSSALIVNTGVPGDTFSPRVPPGYAYFQAINYAIQITSRSAEEYVYNSDPMLKKRGYTPDVMMLDITTTPSATTNIVGTKSASPTITITATTPDPNDSVLLANDVAKGFQRYNQNQLQQQLNTVRKGLQDEYAALQKQNQSLETSLINVTTPTDAHIPLWTADRADIISNMEKIQAQLVQLPVSIRSKVSITQLAEVSDESTVSKAALIVASTAGLGLMLGCVLLLLMAFLDTRLRGAEEVKEALGLASLGGISRGKDMQKTPLLPTGIAVRQLADISTNLRLTGVLPTQWRSPEGAVLLVTSTQIAEGKTTIAIGLATTVARSGKTVVVVDGNLRNPSTHLTFGIRPVGQGLSGLLKVGARESVDDVVQRTSMPGVWLVSNGAPIEDAALVLQEKFPALLAQLRKKADLVIIDGPALLSGAEASLLARMADGVAFVVDASFDKVSLLEQAKEFLKTLTSTPVGVVMNRLPRRRRYLYYAATSAEEQSVPAVVTLAHGFGQ